MKNIIFVTLGFCAAMTAAFPNTSPPIAMASGSTESPENQTTIDTMALDPLTSIHVAVIMTQSTCEEQKALEEKNKELVMMAYQEVFGDYNIDDAVDKYFRPDYIQHNPDAADGRQGLKDFAKVFTQGQEKTKLDIRKISAEGDLVWIQLKYKAPSGKSLAIIDIFRIEDGQIAEHWDVIQEIPDLSTSKNPHPFF